MFPKGKLYFKNPKMGNCIGYQELGDCTKCLERNPAMISCKKLGEYLPKDLWNRVIGHGALYEKDYKAREATMSNDMKGRQEVVDRRGRAKRNSLLFRPRKVA